MVTPSIKAKLTLDLDKNRLKRDLQDATGGVSLGVRGGAGGGIRGGILRGGRAGTTGVAAGVLGGEAITEGLGKALPMIAVAAGSLFAIKKGMDRLVQASPRLQSSFLLMKKSFDIMLRPVADTLDLFVRPLAIAMLRFAIPFYRKFKEKGLAGAVSDVAKETVAGGLAKALIPGKDEEKETKVKGIIQTFFDLVNFGFDFLRDNWKSVLAFITLPFDVLQDILIKKVPEWIGIGLNWLEGFFRETVPAWIHTGFDWMTEFFAETIPKWIRDGFNWIEGFFKVTIPAWIKAGWDWLQEFFKTTIPSWIEAGTNKIKEFFTVTMPGWFNTAISKISDLWNNVKSKFDIVERARDLVERFSRGRRNDFIMRPGQGAVSFNPQDTIIGVKDPSALGAGGGTFNITNNVNATISSDTDIERLAERLAELTKDETFRRVSFLRS